MDREGPGTQVTWESCQKDRLQVEDSHWQEACQPRCHPLDITCTWKPCPGGVSESCKAPERQALPLPKWVSGLSLRTVVCEAGKHPGKACAGLFLRADSPRCYLGVCESGSSLPGMVGATGFPGMFLTCQPQEGTTDQDICPNWSAVPCPVSPLISGTLGDRSGRACCHLPEPSEWG